MSKIPNHGLWARATTSAAAASSSSGRAVSVLAKPNQQNATNLRAWQQAHGTSPSAQATSSPSSSISASGALLSTQEAAALASMGAVSAPYYGPQPASVVVAFEQRDSRPQHQQQPAQAMPCSIVGDSSSYSVIVPSLVPSFGPLTTTSTTASALSSAQLLSSMALKSVLFSAPNGAMAAPRPYRAAQMWAQGYKTSTASSAAASSSAYGTDASAQTRVAFPPSVLSRQRAKSRPVFDIRESAESAKGKAAQKSSAALDAEMERVEEFFTSLWLNSKMEQNSIVGENFTTSARQSATSRSPSPQRARSRREVGPRGLQHGVREPPQKFAVTTSAESTLSSSTGAGEGANGGAIAGNSLAACNTATTSASSSSSSGALPQGGELTDHWARHFNIPRAYKRHDFMFEHGAYGIPKRHPLSSIRKASLPSASGNTDSSEGRAPRRDQVPSSRVQAAQDMLAAAAGFLAGTSSGDHYSPTNGQDALRAAFSGGSTADGRELLSDAFSASRKGAKRRVNPHRMAIRGVDGRIIKDRLRSVQVGEDAYFLRPDSLGVADGVGGWASRPGADPALFSRLLMHFCAVELSRYDGASASDLAADDGGMLKAWAAVNPVEVMHRAWERCVRASRREGILGSSTALIALLRGDELRIANMGDCVLMIIRGGEMIFRSTEQQHSFNFPVQLGMMGDTTESLKKHASTERAAAEGEVSGAAAGSQSGEPLEDYDDVEDYVHASDKERHDLNALPPGVSNGEDVNASNSEDDDEPAWDEPRRDAGRWTVRVEAGDIIVVGSDGLMDNLFDEDIMEEVIRFLPKNSSGQPDQDQLGKSEGAHIPGASLSLSASDKSSSSSAASRFSPQLVSEALCSRAKAVSEDSRAISSPFQQRAMEEGLNYVGGKHDDISVLVCLVGEREVLDADTMPPQPTKSSDDTTAPSA